MLSNEKIGDMTSDVVVHFFESFAGSAKLNIYGTAEGANDHHKAEAVFKAFECGFYFALKELKTDLMFIWRLLCNFFDFSALK